MYNLNSIFQESKMLDIVSYYKPVSERQQKRPVPPLTVHDSAIALSTTNVDFLIPGQPQQVLSFASNEINVNPNEIIAQNNTTPSIPPLNLPFSPKLNESTTNIRNGADVPMSLDNSVDVANKSNSSNDLLNRYQDKNLSKNRKNGSIIVQQEDVSSLNSSSLSSKLSNFDKSLMDKSASELLRAATLADGELDYDTLKVLLRQQRKAYKKRLDEEKIKREALEEFIVKIGTPRKSADEAERNRKSARRRVRPNKSGSADEDASVVSSSTADTNSLLMHLVGHHLRSKSRRRRWSRRSASTSTIRSDGERPSSPNLHRSATNGFIEQNGKAAENFYESTSLFSMREGFLLPDEFLKNTNQKQFMQDFRPEPIDSHPHSDDGLILNGHSTLTNDQNGEIVKHHLPPHLPLSGETSAYSSARRRRSQELSLRQASRQSGSTNGSSNGGPPSRSSSFPKVGTSRSFQNKPPIAFFVSLQDNVLSKTQVNCATGFTALNNILPRAGVVSPILLYKICIILCQWTITEIYQLSEYLCFKPANSIFYFLGFLASQSFLMYTFFICFMFLLHLLGTISF